MSINPVFTREPVQIPRNHLPRAELDPDTAYQVVHDQLMLDGNARLNLATFVTTWMEPQATQLMTECFDKNMIDKDEYPRTADLELRCVRMLAELWHAPSAADATGCSTTGSSEACMLAGLALKRRWQHARKAAGKPVDRPNIVMGVNVQICWDKFANYWDVEPRLIPMSGDRFHLCAAEAAAHCDENTIGVVAVLGSTFDGSYEPVAEICAALDHLQTSTGLNVPVHVDGASGAMIAPFSDPELVWDFALPRVASINTSGHKYGLVYPGVGWVLWRDAAALPEDLVFRVNYLGGNMPTFALNFSRPGAQVIAQYYNFLRLGFDGYRRVQQTCREVATTLAEKIGELGPFRLLTRGDELPVFAFTLAEHISGYSVFDVSAALREHGWLVPAYTFPEHRTDLAVLRIVVRNGFTHDLADLLLADLLAELPRLERQSSPQRGTGSSSFAHGASPMAKQLVSPATPLNMTSTSSGYSRNSRNSHSVLAILFDIDGTLITTGGASGVAWHRAFTDLYGVSANVDEFTSAGMTDPEVARLTFTAVIGHDPDPRELAQLLAKRLEHLPAAVAESTGYRVLPGVTELLPSLVQRGYLLGLTTGLVESAAHIKLVRGDLNTYFHFGGYGSDSPDRTELTRRGIGRAGTVLGTPVDPRHVWVVGDTPLDIAAAHGAGAVAIGVASGGYTAEALRDAGADHVLRALTDELPLPRDDSPC